MQSGQGNMVAGMGKLYLAAYGTPHPATTGASLDWTGWTDLGRSDGGMALEIQNSFTGHKVDQETMPVFHTLDESTAKVTFKMAEVHADNLVKVIANAAKSATAAGAGQVGLETVKIGGQTFTVWSVGIEGRSPKSPANANYWRMIYIPRVISASTVNLGFKKGEKALVDVELLVQADLTLPEEERICKIVDMVAPAT